MVKLTARTKIMSWQLSFLLVATTWLWAPILNDTLSTRTSLISQYETSSQPYAWLFRLGDILGGVLVILIARYFNMHRQNKYYSYLLLAVGFGLFLDPILSTTCVNTGRVCKEYFSLSFVLHASETVLTAAVVLMLSFYDWWKRRRLVSAVFILFQILYGLLFLTQLADQEHFNTASQYVYQTTLIVWIAWFCRSILFEGNFKVNQTEVKIVKYIVGIWAFLNGVLAILVSLAHIHLFGHIRGLYFAGDSAWLAQHGVIVGVIMIYLSRHLVRGERRARQIFLLITGLETIKYAVISPNAPLLMLYLLTFCILFVLVDDFDRGTQYETFTLRLKDALFMVGSLLAVILVVLMLVARNAEDSRITSQSIDNFFDYTVRSQVIYRTHLRSALLAHTETAFALASVGTILWILFKPYKRPGSSGNHEDIKRILKQYSNSSEDYFKLWPKDKNYYFLKDLSGFIAYKQAGPIIFALADPISDKSNKIKLLNNFIKENKAARLRTCFLMLHGQDINQYKKAGLEVRQIGASAQVDIDKFLNGTARDKWWRWKKNNAVKSGYQYSVSQPPHSDIFLQQLKAVSDEWLKIGGHEERGFALGYFDEHYMKECEVHYLHNERGKIFAFTNQLPQFKNHGVATVDLLRYLPDANNAMPYLLLCTIESAKQNDFKVFDLGFVPFAKSSDPVINIARTLSAGRFSAKGLEQFKNKFDPIWEPMYMAYDGDLADVALIAINVDRVMGAKPHNI
jgi:lysylphosphatidylglycerol synthetase-like protein (DUF2156 family)